MLFRSLAEACDNEFTEEEMRVILDLLLQAVPYDGQQGRERYRYLRQKYNLLQLYASQKPIANRFHYLKSILPA